MICYIEDRKIDIVNLIHFLLFTQDYLPENKLSALPNTCHLSILIISITKNRSTRAIA